MLTLDDRVFGPESPVSAVARLQRLLEGQHDQS
jgi:hypothetical protein